MVIQVLVRLFVYKWSLSGQEQSTFSGEKLTVTRKVRRILSPLVHKNDCFGDWQHDLAPEGAV